MKILREVLFSIFTIVNGMFKRFNLCICFIPRYTEKLKTNRPDYVRSGTLELLSRKLYESNIEGAVAELGVYRGDFAKDINAFFPDRKLYLFDTFEGFPEKDLIIEHQNHYLNCDQDFSKTSVNAVLKKMKYKGNCIIKKGFFPDSTKDLDDQFCLVSLDADLYSPTKSGLDFFWPRLSRGGYIMVHDYDNHMYLGAKKAVLEFATEQDVNFICLPDCCGSAVFLKH